jgi:predicted RecA/RadA family phage recombinase
MYGLERREAMAKNYVQPGKFINAAPTDPEIPDSGDPVIVGKIAGVAITKEGEGGNAPGQCTIATKGVFNLPVAGLDALGDPAAVAKGDRLYYAAGVLSGVNTGVLFGKALGAVEEGDPDPVTTVIPVMLIQA